MSPANVRRRLLFSRRFAPNWKRQWPTYTTYATDSFSSWNAGRGGGKNASPTIIPGIRRRRALGSSTFRPLRRPRAASTPRWTQEVTNSTWECRYFGNFLWWEVEELKKTEIAKIIVLQGMKSFLTIFGIGCIRSSMGAGILELWLYWWPDF